MPSIFECNGNQALLENIIWINILNFLNLNFSLNFLESLTLLNAWIYGAFLFQNLKTSHVIWWGLYIFSFSFEYLQHFYLNFRSLY